MGRQVQEFIADVERKYLESDKYKTIGKYGKKGWWMHEAHRRATIIYDDIVERARQDGLVPRVEFAGSQHAELHTELHTLDLLPQIYFHRSTSIAKHQP